MKHALIIEDDPRVSNALEDRLIHLGFRSFEKSWTEEDGVAAAARRRPDLVVVGESLASGSPINAARRIARNADVPILLVTDRLHQRLPALPAGARLEGPHPLDELASAIALAD